MTQTYLDGGAAIALTVNGERREVPGGTTLGALLRELGLEPQMIVVERNREILRDRDAFDALELEPDDELELVHFVGGG